MKSYDKQSALVNCILKKEKKKKKRKKELKRRYQTENCISCGFNAELKNDKRKGTTRCDQMVPISVKRF